MNNNGERLLECCGTFDLVIGGTLFPHPDIHKLTWCSPNGRDKNQIDHLVINGTWRRSLQDVRVRRGADVGSDHHLVTATLKVKLRKNGPERPRQQQFDMEKLRDPKAKNAFILKLKNKFQALADAENYTQTESAGIDTAWKQVRSAYTQTSEPCLGRGRKRRKEWITTDTWKAIENRRTLKKKVLETKSERLEERCKQQYREADQTMKRMARANKRAYMEGLAREAEEAAARGEQGRVYKITKLVSGKYRRSTDTPIADKQGRILTTEAEQEARWAEHFSEVLNRPPPTAPAEVQDPAKDLDVNTTSPEKQEIVAAIRSLKNGKGPGQDSLNAELFKADPELAAQVLQPLFTAIWDEKQLPEDWMEGVIVKIPKKGALSNRNNWRGMTLLSVPSKILAKIIIKRIEGAVDQQLRKEQAGFRPGRGCTDQIFTLRNIIEQCTEWQRQLYINFVDFEKAFDSIHRESLLRILRAYGIPQGIVLVIKSFYNNFTCRVGSNETSFSVKTGVRQGCCMSAMLFNLTIDWVMRQTTADQVRGIRWTLLTQLEDLDDLALMTMI